MGLAQQTTEQRWGRAVRQHLYDPELGLLLASGTVEIDESEGRISSRFWKFHAWMCTNRVPPWREMRMSQMPCLTNENSTSTWRVVSLLFDVFPRAQCSRVDFLVHGARRTSRLGRIKHQIRVRAICGICHTKKFIKIEPDSSRFPRDKLIKFSPNKSSQSLQLNFYLFVGFGKNLEENFINLSDPQSSLR